MTSGEPISSSTQVLRHPDSGADTVNIAVGVSVPVVIGLVVVLALYLWYRKKYPVRMIMGREFAKFSNPDYKMKTSTLTLVRDDAEEYFQSNKTGSCMGSSLTLVSEQQPTGPHYDNMAFQSDSEAPRTLSRAEEEEEEDRQLMQRKKYLFTHRDSVFTTDGKVLCSGSENSEVNPHQMQVCIEQHDESADIEDEPTAVYENIILTHKTTSSAVSSDDNSDLAGETEQISESGVDGAIGETKDHRAVTCDESAMRRYSIDPSLSARGRSKSVVATGEYGYITTKLPKDINNRESDHSVRGRSRSVIMACESDDVNFEQIKNTIYADSNTQDSSISDTVPEMIETSTHSDHHTALPKERSSSSSEVIGITDDLDACDLHKDKTTSSDYRDSDSSKSEQSDTETIVIIKHNSESNKSSEQSNLENSAISRHDSDSSKSSDKAYYENIVISRHDSESSKSCDQAYYEDSAISRHDSDSSKSSDHVYYEDIVISRHDSNTSKSPDKAYYENIVISRHYSESSKSWDQAYYEDSVISRHDSDSSKSSDKAYYEDIVISRHGSDSIKSPEQSKIENYVMSRHGSDSSKSSEELSHKNTMITTHGSMSGDQTLGNPDFSSISTDGHEHILIQKEVAQTTDLDKATPCVLQTSILTSTLIENNTVAHSPSTTDDIHIPSEQTDYENFAISRNGKYAGDSKCISSEQNNVDLNVSEVDIRDVSYGNGTNHLQKGRPMHEDDEPSINYTTPDCVNEAPVGVPSFSSHLDMCLSKSENLTLDTESSVSSSSNTNQFLNNENDHSTTNYIVSDRSSDIHDDTEMNYLFEKIPYGNTPIMVTDLDDSSSLSSFNQSQLDSSIDASSNCSYSPSLEKKTLNVSEPRTQGLPKKAQAPVFDLSEYINDEYSSSDDDENLGHGKPFSNFGAKSVAVTAGVLQLPEITEESDSGNEMSGLNGNKKGISKDVAECSNKVELQAHTSHTKKVNNGVCSETDSSTSDDDASIKFTDEDILNALGSDESNEDRIETQLTAPRVINIGSSQTCVLSEENDDIDV